ncbi:hypothetical protein F8M41_011990 [Gigaspora margarita]|uniref:F-box domain-containing protein n=1 Tax=Gigaspora margarita TaxID=4874 RepID=A0A8H4EPT7_GIGMA|nr:hypothetical protein F8M41_011990 [Gigaspora margarita]
MASKIFMGDMPELMENILNNLKNEFYSLYSCALVNRHWCLYFSEYVDFKTEVLHSLERNVLFLSQIQDLSLSSISGYSFESATKLLKILAKSFPKINTLEFNDFYSDYKPQIYHALICIIKSHDQLRRFNLTGTSFKFPANFHGIISALKNQNQSLREVIIQNCTCSAEFKVLMKCENLEILRIRNCNNVELLTLSYCKINTLEIVDSPINGSNMSLIFEKSGSFLQQLKLGAKNKMIIEDSSLLALKSFCPKITYLNLSYIEFSTQLLDLIGNLKNLQFLTLGYLYIINNDIIVEDQVRLFAEILPSTLQYLDLRYTFLNSFIVSLLNNCYAPLKKLLINRLNDEKQIKALIEFSLRNRSLNYVGINRYSSLGNNIQSQIKEYVKLVPYERIVVDC